MNYKEAGVDVKKGDAFVESIKKKVHSTYGNRVVSGVGGFACLYEMGDRLLVAGTDGVGTKLKLAHMLKRHDTIGIDLVAMCANDILCTGATPLFFMDYLACGKLNTEISEEIITGIVEGCKQSEMALIGGETAEMPGFYEGEDYDLAGFAVGEVKKENLISGQDIKEGDTLIGIASSGFHSNGYSLLRKLIKVDELELLYMALTPTKIYHNTLKPLLKEKNLIKGLAHITGGGIQNIPRMNENFDYHLFNLPKYEEINPLFKIIKERSKLNDAELYNTFNMGVGMVLATSNPDKLGSLLESAGEKCWILGEVKKGIGKALLNN